MKLVKSSLKPYEDEYFMEHPILPVKASNYGRFLVRHNNGSNNSSYFRITPGAKRRRCNIEPKYEYVIGVRHKGKRKLKPATHIIMQCFLLEPLEGQYIVDHIDGNSENNKIENLTWVTPKQNANNVNNKSKK